MRHTHPPPTEKTMTAPDLINLIKCIGIGVILILIALVIYAIAETTEYPDDDGDHL